MTHSRKNFNRIKTWLSRLSFRTGIIMLIACVVCYAISFAQLLFPLSLTIKGILWIVFFGMAKTLQYSAIAVLGVEGVKRFKQWGNNHRHK